MARSWLHEDDGRNCGPPRELVDAAELLVERIYFSALVLRVVRAIDRRDTREMLQLLGIVQKGDLQRMTMMRIDLIAEYCTTAGVSFEEVRHALRL